MVETRLHGGLLSVLQQNMVVMSEEKKEKDSFQRSKNRMRDLWKVLVCLRFCSRGNRWHQGSMAMVKFASPSYG